MQTSTMASSSATATNERTQGALGVSIAAHDPCYYTYCVPSDYKLTHFQHLGPHKNALMWSPYIYECLDEWLEENEFEYITQLRVTVEGDRIVAFTLIEDTTMPGYTVGMFGNEFQEFCEGLDHWLTYYTACAHTRVLFNTNNRPDISFNSDCMFTIRCEPLRTPIVDLTAPELVDLTME